MLDAPAALASLVRPWADFYSDSHLAQTVVTFAHVGALVVGGGMYLYRKAKKAVGPGSRTRNRLDAASSTYRQRNR